MVRISAVVLALFLSACTNDYGSMRFPHGSADDPDASTASADAGPDAVSAHR